MREPEPRYSNENYPLRSTFGQFVENSHAHGSWYRLEDHVEYKNLPRVIGYPVERLVHIFHPAVVADSSKENKMDNEVPTPEAIDDQQPQPSQTRPITVSYTHLTLPTKRIV